MAKKQIEMAETVAKVATVKCCGCGASLKVKENGAVYTCPSCGQIFQLRRTEKMVKSLYNGPISEAFVSVCEDNKGNILVESEVKEN